MQKNLRNLQFDLLRIFFATLVLLSHAPEITDGNPSRELLSRLTQSPVTFGTVGVAGFFLLSGFLIVRSWQSRPNFTTFMRKRLLRIVPGYIVAALSSTILIGVLAPADSHFFRGLRGQYFESLLILSSPLTPAVLPGSHYPLVNGSLWTITYEFRCYVLVALAGCVGIVHRWLWLVGAFLSFTLWLSPFSHDHLYWHRHYMLLGDPHQMFWLLGTFLTGGCFYLFRDRIRFSPVLAITAALVIALAFLSSVLPQLAVIVSGGYLMFYFARAPILAPEWAHHIPDVSYGAYLYGWPVEILWIWYFRGSPWITFVLSVFVCCGLGFASWHFIEKPVMKWNPSNRQTKRRSRACLGDIA